MPQEELPDLRPVLRPIRIIVFALVLGVVVFEAIAISLVMVINKGPMAPANGLMTWLAFGFAAIVGTAQLFVPNAIVASARRRLARMSELAELSGLISAFRTKTIVGAALCESVAFMALICYIQEGDLTTLLLATLFTALIAVRFPTANGLAAWLERQRDLIHADRAESRDGL